MPMPEFKNEALFRTEWIAPFLSKLGYILPKHVHGTTEQGKDFYFAEHDKFGHLRFLAAQVKNGDIGAGSVELDQLLNQVRRCFAVTLKHHKGAENQRISAVYIMASGKISATGREYISDAMRQEHYGENVYYLDGETLYNLERHASYTEDRTTRQRLVALLNEILFNRRAHGHLKTTSADKKPNFLACRILVLNDCLTTPMPEELLPQQFLSLYWAYIAEHNKHVSNLPMVYNNPENFIEFAHNAIEQSVILELATRRAIGILDERYSLELEVTE